MGKKKMKERIENVFSCMLSILDSIKLHDKGILYEEDETLSQMMFRKMKGYNIDLNKELGFDHLKPVDIDERDGNMLILEMEYHKEASENLLKWIQDNDCHQKTQKNGDILWVIGKKSKKMYDYKDLYKIYKESTNV